MGEGWGRAPALLRGPLAARPCADRLADRPLTRLIFCPLFPSLRSSFFPSISSSFNRRLHQVPQRAARRRDARHVGAHAHRLPVSGRSLRPDEAYSLRPASARRKGRRGAAFVRWPGRAAEASSSTCPPFFDEPTHPFLSPPFGRRASTARCPPLLTRAAVASAAVPAPGELPSALPLHPVACCFGWAQPFCLRAPCRYRVIPRVMRAGRGHVQWMPVDRGRAGGSGRRRRQK